MNDFVSNNSPLSVLGRSLSARMTRGDNGVRRFFSSISSENFNTSGVLREIVQLFIL